MEPLEGVSNAPSSSQPDGPEDAQPEWCALKTPHAQLQLGEEVAIVVMQ